MQGPHAAANLCCRSLISALGRQFIAFKNGQVQIPIQFSANFYRLTILTRKVTKFFIGFRQVSLKSES